MKTSMTPNELAVEIERQSTHKQDYIAPTNMMTMQAYDDPQELFMLLGDADRFGINRYAHQQIAQHTDIPFKYYQRMMEEAPDLLVENTNHWFQNKSENRLVRTLDGNMRAYLSNRYRLMDNYDLMEAILPALSAAGASIHSADVSDSKLYIKAVVDSMTATIPPPINGQRNEVAVQPGIIISNSEVGDGAIAVQPAIHTLACLNMAVWAQNALRKHHLGKRLSDDNESIQQYMSDQTKELSDAALWSQIRDIANAAMSGTMFEDIVQQLTAARSETFTPHNANNVVEKLTNRYGLHEVEKTGVMGYLIDGNDFSKFGLHNAVTRTGQDFDSYQRATEFEVLGGEIISLGQRDWDALIREVAA